MRIKHKVNVVITEDTAGKDKLLALDDVAAEVVLDGFTEQNSGKVVVPANTSFTIPFGGVGAVRGVFLKAANDFTVSLNGGPVINILRGVVAPAGVKAASARLFLEASLSSVEVSVGASAVPLTYAIWGDPVA